MRRCLFVLVKLGCCSLDVSLQGRSLLSQSGPVRLLKLIENINKSILDESNISACEAVTGEALGKLIRAAVAGENVADYAAEVSEVSDVLKKELAEEIKKGLEIRPTKDVQQGFRLAAKDGSGYFDCSDDGIMEMLMPYFRDLDFQ